MRLLITIILKKDNRSFNASNKNNELQKIDIYLIDYRNIDSNYTNSKYS